LSESWLIASGGVIDDLMAGFDLDRAASSRRSSSSRTCRRRSRPRRHA